MGSWSWQRSTRWPPGRLRRDDQRYTEKRKALVEVLQTAGRPLSMPSILEQSPGMAQSSVYRNLAVLEHAAIVRRIVTTDDHASFELAEDLSSHHHHLICTSLRQHRGLPRPRGHRGPAQPGAPGAARRHRFKVTDHVLDLFGTCKACTSA